MKQRQKFSPPPFLVMLQQIYDVSLDVKKISLQQMFTHLSGRGYAAILIIFTLPFCLPIQIPGVSTLFGLVLAFIGLRVCLGRELWWPHWILKKEIESVHLQKWLLETIKIVKMIQKILHPRLIMLTQNHFFHRLHGFMIFVLALLLALPLPIPLTNLLCAFPLLFIGMGLLEDDGLFIIIGYILAFTCFSVFTAIFIFGAMQLKNMII